MTWRLQEVDPVGCHCIRDILSASLALSPQHSDSVLLANMPQQALPVVGNVPVPTSNLPVAAHSRAAAVLQRLVKDQRISFADSERALEAAGKTDESVASVLARLEIMSTAEWAEAISEIYDIPLAGRGDFPRQPLLTERISPRFIRNSLALPLAVDDDRLHLALADPGDEFSIRAFRIASGLEIVPRVASIDDLREAYTRYWDTGASALARIGDDFTREDYSNLDDPEELRDRAEDVPVVRYVNQLLSDALRARASDIHIEPHREGLHVRYRVHGRLREISDAPPALSAPVISRLKIMAKLDIAERRLPQDGRARLTLLDRTIDARVATLPTPHGESMVVRLLEHDARAVEMGELGMNETVHAKFDRAIRSAYGMVLVTGPTGSGKTTTLYGALRRLNARDSKLVSIEDPIEYQIDGVTQIQTQAEIGLTFARVLRSVVRHDPDIIMVGETRDPETADIAVHSALTGHLVLSTLHTNSASGAIARLLDMNVEPYLLASVLRGVLGQRLVGVLCEKCRVSKPLSEEDRALFDGAG
ncbi:MAG: GspE/PulE family protein, partial [Pseudomonadota bacterium]